MKNFLILCFLAISLQSISQDINIPDQFFLNELINQGYDQNGDGIIQIDEADMQISMQVISDQVTSLEGIEFFTNLNYLELMIYGNPTIELDLSNQSDLQTLYLYGININTLDLTPLVNLEQITIQDIQSLSSLDFSNSSKLLSVIIESVANIETLDFSASVDLLDIILTGIIDLKYLDVSNSPQLISLYCWDTTIEELDLSRNYNLIDLIIGTNLKYLNIKNNSQESLACLADLDALTFICADEEDLEDIDMLLEGCTVNEVTVSTNCISPFDQPSTLFVKSYLDTINNNLCEETDLILRIPLKFQSTSNSNPFWECVQFYSNIGAYKLPAEEFNCTPLLGELEECFIIEPNNVLLDFTDTTSITQDFCITGIGESTNVGVGLISLDDDVRPGFNVQYKLKFYNHGSMSSDGLIRMSYNSELMDLVSSIPMMIEDGDNLIFEYENLLPFEERNIILEFNLNTPTDDPALNDGDFLEYTVFIFPENADLKRTDNFSYLSQEVINSFDPNDKTCMQGKFLMDTLVGSYLTYKIRFENIGTASAVNVLIEDKIDTTVFDTETMVIEDASHDLLAYVREDRINFNFLDIFLPFEDEFNDGYVVFKIKTKNNMQVGDVIRNQASIVFDFNEAIITNIAETTIVTDADQDGYHNLEDCDDADANVNPDAEEIAGNDIDEDCDGEILSSVDNLYRLSFSLFPNPAEDILNINQHNLANFQVRVIDLNGKVLVQGNNLTKIDVSTFEDGIYLMENMDLESGVRGSQRFMVY